MTSYRLVNETPVWQEAVYDVSTEEIVCETTRTNGVVEGEMTYVWIEANDRDEVIKLHSFQLGEEIIEKLSDGTYENLEEACEDNEEAYLDDSPYQ